MILLTVSCFITILDDTCENGSLWQGETTTLLTVIGGTSPSRHMMNLCRFGKRPDGQTDFGDRARGLEMEPKSYLLHHR